MKTTDLKTYFKKINYDFSKDEKKLSHICTLTKTRVDPTKKEFVFDYGMEQTFFIKAFAEHIKCEKFFEIGTGRGTSSYAVSLIESVKNIVTVDVVFHNQKKQEAINYAPATVSNSDLYDLIQLEEKNKIQFKHIDDYMDIIEEHNESFDCCFIDGDHDNESIIINDFNICMKVLKKPGYIIWDDYDPRQFKVKQVVDKICQEKKYSCELIEFKGHIFGDKDPEKNAGEVIMKIE